MKITTFEAGFATILERFYLMMAVVILGWFTGQIWLMFFALPIFLSAILGIKFEKEIKEAKQIQMKPQRESRNMKKAA